MFPLLTLCLVCVLCLAAAPVLSLCIALLGIPILLVLGLVLLAAACCLVKALLIVPFRLLNLLPAGLLILLFILLI